MENRTIQLPTVLARKSAASPFLFLPNIILLQQHRLWGTVKPSSMGVPMSTVTENTARDEAPAASVPRGAAEVLNQIVTGMADDSEVTVTFSEQEWLAVTAWFETGKLTDADGLAEALRHEEPGVNDEAAVTSGG